MDTTRFEAIFACLNRWAKNTSRSSRIDEHMVAMVRNLDLSAEDFNPADVVAVLSAVLSMSRSSKIYKSSTGRFRARAGKVASTLRKQPEKGHTVIDQWLVKRRR